MENARTYITFKLNELVKNIPQLGIFYQFDALSKEHLIKVLPASDYKDNELYQQAEEKLLFEFIERYPFDSLVFLTEEDWIDIENPEMVFKGEVYNQSELISFFSQFNTSFNDNEYFHFDDLEDDFIDIGKCLQEFEKSFDDATHKNFLLNLYIENEFYGDHSENDPLKCEEDKVTYDKKDETPLEPNCHNFALAA